MGNAGYQVVEFDRLKAHFEAHGQAHVFRFWGRLEDAQRKRLLAQAAALDLPALLEALQAAQRRGTEPQGHLAPPAVERIPEHGGSRSCTDTARQRGEELLAGVTASFIGSFTLLLYAGWSQLKGRCQGSR